MRYLVITGRAQLMFLLKYAKRVGDPRGHGEVPRENTSVAAVQ